MDLPVNLGDVPTWLQGVGGLAQIVEAVRARRRTQLAEFGRHLQEETQLDEEALARAIIASEELGALVLDALEAAMKAAAEDKRWLLAKVLAVAFSGDDARIDEVALLLRTVTGLEAPDIRLFAEFARPRPQNYAGVPMVGAIPESELASVLPSDQADLLAPIIGRLSHEGLVRDESEGTFDRFEPAWSPTAYGYRFLHYLPGMRPDILKSAVVVGVWSKGNVDSFLLKNLGPAKATITAIEVQLGPTPTSIQHGMAESVVDDEGTLVAGDNLKVSPSLPVTIDPGQRIEVACVGPAARVLYAATSLDLRWTDDNGDVVDVSQVLEHNRLTPAPVM